MEEKKENDRNSNRSSQYIAEIYSQISRKGILSYYGDMETGDFMHAEKKSGGGGETDSISSDIDLGSIPAKISIVDQATAIPIKPSITERGRVVGRTVLVQTVVSLLRNAGCYLCLACAIYLVVEGSDYFQGLEVEVDVTIIPLVLLCVGFVAVPFQVVHAVRELTPTKSGPSVLATMLQSPISRAALREELVRLQTAAPYVGAEIRVRWFPSCCLFAEKDDAPQKSASGTAKLDTVFHYDAWADLSRPVDELTWSDRDHSTGWIVLGKDYRMSGPDTETWMKEESDRFKRSVGYDRNESCMSFRYVLDVQEGCHFPDAQALLVYPGDETVNGLYSLRLYKAMLCLCVDGVYGILFHICTRMIGHYDVVKCIERRSTHALY